MALLLLLLAQDPVIESVERLAGDVDRPLLWAPVRVVLSSAAGWDGDLVSRSRFGFTVARRVRVPAGGREAVLLPTLDAEQIEAGAAKSPIPRGRSRADLVVAVDSRLPFAAELVSSEKVHYARVDAGILRELLASGMLEAADLALLSDSAGLEFSAPVETRVVKTREEAERAAAPAVRVEARDAAVCQLRPPGGWVPAKRERGALFAGLYGFAGFVALALAARRGGRAVPIAVAALAVVGLVGAAALVPGGRLYVEERVVEISRPDEPAVEWRIWFAAASSPGALSIELPRLAKPVFPAYEGAAKPFTLRVDERGCRVEGLDSEVSVAFASASAGKPSPGPLRDAWEFKHGKFRALDGTTWLSEPKDAEYRAWKRFADVDCEFGRFGEGEAVADVASPDLADARRRPRYVIRRAK